MLSNDDLVMALTGNFRTRLGGPLPAIVTVGARYCASAWSTMP